MRNYFRVPNSRARSRIQLAIGHTDPISASARLIGPMMISPGRSLGIADDAYVTRRSALATGTTAPCSADRPAPRPRSVTMVESLFGAGWRR